MTDERKDPSELSDADKPTGNVSSPYDSPTEQFPTVSAKNPLPRTDDDLDFGSTNANSLTEQIPTYRAPGADQPTVALERETAYDAPIAAVPHRRSVAGTTESPRGGRGTLDLGLLALRLAVGGTALVHGLQKLTGVWNGPGAERVRVDAGGRRVPAGEVDGDTRRRR